MIDTGVAGNVTTIWRARPERRNALTPAMLDALAGAVTDAGDRRSRAVVLAGRGGSFCSGADVEVVRDEGFVATLRDTLERLRVCACPTIAALDGFVLGAGAQLALACDLRTATTDTTIGVPAARLGVVVPEWVIRRAASLLGQGPARALFLGGEQFDGQRAAQLGFVQRLGGVEEAQRWAGEIAKLAPLSMAAHKLGLNVVEDLEPSATYQAAYRDVWASADLAEGLAAFSEKRSPRFRGA